MKEIMRFLNFCFEPKRCDACINCSNFVFCADKLNKFNNNKEFRSAREKFYEGKWFIAEALDNEKHQTYILTSDYHQYEKFIEENNKFEEINTSGPFVTPDEALKCLEGLIFDEWDY